jgi:hypothetical protein
MKRIHRVYSRTILLFVTILVLGLSGPVSATLFPGPDTFGYTGTVITPTLRDISASGTFVGLSDDQLSAPLPIGFTFNFYGISYTQFKISSNGYITLGTAETNSGCCTGDPIPSAIAPNNVIAGWWEDLNNPQGNIRYQTTGAVGSRELIVGFYSVPHFLNGPQVTFEIVLHEGTDSIEIQCDTCPVDDFFHTIGIEDSTGSDGLQIARTTSSLPQSGWLLRPNNPPDCSIAAADPDTIWPPNHQMVAVDITGVTDPDGDPFTITVDGVFQNEAVSGRGAGNTAPDATLDPLAVRAERAGGEGSGRIYHIDFTAEDSLGATSECTVTVCVPDDQNSDSCSGPLYDSTLP